MSAIHYVVPAYNAADWLGETLRSLIAQTRADWSATVVDDGSTDATAEVAGSTGDARITLVRQENRGLAGARNRGLASAPESEAVCFVDADDTIAPDHAAVMLEALRGHDLAACAYRMAGPRLEDLGWTICPGDHDHRIDRLVEFNPFVVGGVVIRRGAPARLGRSGALFDTSLRVHEDWDCWLRLTAAGADWAPIVRRPLYTYRLQPGTMTSNLGRMWVVGCDVIRAAPVPDELKPVALRRWTIRHVARAVARGDADLTRRLLAELRVVRTDGLGEDDAGLLAGSMRWAFCQQEQIGPDRAGAREEAWRAQAGRILAGIPGIERLMTRIGWPADRWDRVAAAIRKRLGGRDVVVLYGVGRNGRDLADAIGRLTPTPKVAWIDDHADASPPAIKGRELPRLRLDHLTGGHLVVVTPDDRRAILDRLGAAGVPRVETPDSLLDTSGQTASP